MRFRLWSLDRLQYLSVATASRYHILSTISVSLLQSVVQYCLLHPLSTIHFRSSPSCLPAAHLLFFFYQLVAICFTNCNLTFVSLCLPCCHRTPSPPPPFFLGDIYSPSHFSCFYNFPPPFQQHLSIALRSCLHNTTPLSVYPIVPYCSQSSQSSN